MHLPFIRCRYIELCCYATRFAIYKFIQAKRVFHVAAYETEIKCHSSFLVKCACVVAKSSEKG